MIEPLARRMGRLYPLKSGCGPLANAAFFRWLDPAGGPDAEVALVGGKAVVPSGDYVGRAMRYVGDLDPKVSWVIDRVVRPGDVALDIGSNLGLVSLRLAARVGAQGHVHAFDPQPRMQDYFRRTLALNPAAPITLHPIGLGTETATLELAVPGHNAGSASLTRQMAARPGVELVKVPVRALDDYAAEIGLTRVDFIKMDVEGFEAQVIAGGRDLLGRTRPRVIVFEENSPDPVTGLSPALQALLDLDYDLFALPKRLFRVAVAPLSAGLPAHDYVAVARDAGAAVRAALKL